MNLVNLPDPQAAPRRTRASTHTESVWTSLTNQQRMAVQRLILRAEAIGYALRNGITVSGTNGTTNDKDAA